MGKHIFKADLSVKGIEELKKQLLEYRDNELPRKCKLLVEKLTDIGMGVASAKVNESPLSKYITLQSTITAEEAGCRAMIILNGEVQTSKDYPDFFTHIAVEFGAGKHYNPTPNPLVGEFPYGVGTFPGQMHALKDEGWYFWDEKKQEWKHSYGVKATMPMYEAQKAIKDRIGEAVKEVFG